jgi:UDP-N-acetylglucosamine--N-acetylmuramyl-(pentapeptide) pyrophosphoryl-undecaprenol N-acetylglucosamine transferase
MEALRIAVTGGGTGGHTFPALTVIHEIRCAATDGSLPGAPDFMYLGSAHGFEHWAAEREGVPFAAVRTGKLRRGMRRRDVVTRENIRDIFRIAKGIGDALRMLSRFKPHILFATGGYVAVPGVVAAHILKIPILVHEPTPQLGLANRISARLATQVALSFPSSLSTLSPRLRKKATVTGNPVRAEVFSGDAARAREMFEFNVANAELPVVYITGGVQGAQSINRAVEQSLSEILRHCCVIHQCGSRQGTETDDLRHLQSVRASLSPELQGRYYVTPLIHNDQIGDVFALADLIVSRSGAGTANEVAALGKPAIWVPLIPTGGDEQRRIANEFAKVGAALVIPNPQLTPNLLAKSIASILQDEDRRRRMAVSARSLHIPRAAQRLSQIVFTLAGIDPVTGTLEH